MSKLREFFDRSSGLAVKRRDGLDRERDERIGAGLTNRELVEFSECVESGFEEFEHGWRAVDRASVVDTLKVSAPLLDDLESFREDRQRIGRDRFEEGLVIGCFFEVPLSHCCEFDGVEFAI